MEERKRTREVWACNVEQEFDLIAAMVPYFPYISLDTEFPGFLRQTPKTVSGKSLYEDLKFNVDSTKLIQVGLTLSDGRRNLPYPGGVWQFNLRDFNPISDLHGPGSIEFLTNSGINLTKNMADGIDSKLFTKLMMQKGLIGNPNIRWITFHGCYDFAYMVKLLSGKLLPTSLDQFLDLLGSYFGKFYDVKVMAKYCASFCHGERLGLNRLAEIFHVKRVGISHQAGSDSLVTSLLFGKMRKTLQHVGFFSMAFGGKDLLQGSLYGLEQDLHVSKSYNNAPYPLFSPTTCCPPSNLVRYRVHPLCSPRRLFRCILYGHHEVTSVYYYLLNSDFDPSESHQAHVHVQ